MPTQPSLSRLNPILPNPYARICLASFSILFLELVLIRWIPAWLRSFGFFTNFVLLASLLGTGIGMLTHRGSRIPIPLLPVTLIVLIGVTLHFRWSLVVLTTDVLFYHDNASATNEHYGIIPVIFLLIAVTFMPLGRELGRQFAVMPPLRAYTADILGSLAGIASFMLLSWLSLSPIFWFAPFTIVALPLMLGRSRLGDWLNGGLFAVILAVVAVTGGSLLIAKGSIIWSPYYRIDYHENGTKTGTIIAVNNIGHQEAKPYQLKERFYLETYRMFGTPPFRRVLIIGAGSGSDVAAALANGAEHVDAVEIDPRLYQLGVALHPDHPYDDPRVTVHINDGRAFLRHTDAKYDLIVFALTDSLVLTSAQGNVRLESFLFTTESMLDAKRHLSPDGALVAYNFYRQDWSIQKLASMLRDAFDQPPYVVTYGAWGRAAVFIAGPRVAAAPETIRQPYAEHVIPVATGDLPEIGRGLLAGDPSLRPATDDWPFFYMRDPEIPRIYVLGIAMVVVMALLLTGAMAPTGLLRGFEWHFFFLGAAFMLLETRSLVTFELLFGTTWLVNALVFFAILTSVLLAILLNARLRLRHVGIVYVLLFALLAANYLIPVNAMLEIDPPALRYLLASALTFAPVFIANIVFSRSFRDAEHSDSAFAANLLGIMAGGLVEYAALVTGYQALLLPAAAFYLVARLLMPAGQGSRVVAS
jgi:spermidine synthase